MSVGPEIVEPRRGRRRWLSRVRLRIADEEGTERELAEFGGGDVPDRRDPVFLGALAWLRAEAATRRAGWPRVAALIVAILAIASVAPLAALAVGVRRFGLPPYFLVLGLPVFGFLVAALTVNVAAVLTGRALAECADLVRDAMLRMRRCPACGYPFHLGMEGSTDRARCSECGAVWASQRLGRLGPASGGQLEPSRVRQILFTAAGCRSRRRDAAGRRYGPMFLTQRREESLRWRSVIQGRARRSEWFAVGMLLGSIAAGMALAMLLPRGVLTVFLLITGIVVGLVVFLVLIAAMRRRIDRMRLRLKRCLACEGRLRRERDRLHCAACEATWKAIP